MRFTPHRWKILGWQCWLDQFVDWIWDQMESITVESRLFIGSYASRTDESSPKTDESSPTEAPPTRMRPLLANWKAISGMPMEARDLPLSISLRLQHVPPLFGVHGPGAPPGIKKPSWQNPWGKSMFSHHCLSATKLGFWLLLLLFAAWILLQLQMDSNKRWATHYSKNERNCSFVLCWRLRY